MTSMIFEIAYVSVASCCLSIIIHIGYLVSFMYYFCLVTKIVRGIEFEKEDIEFFYEIENKIS